MHATKPDFVCFKYYNGHSLEKLKVKMPLFFFASNLNGFFRVSTIHNKAAIWILNGPNL